MDRSHVHVAFFRLFQTPHFFWDLGDEVTFDALANRGEYREHVYV